MRCYGYTLRMNEEIIPKVLKMKMKGKHPRGRLRLR
jgi:hypothetical protein